jgi:hypothetical protein
MFTANHAKHASPSHPGHQVYATSQNYRNTNTNTNRAATNPFCQEPITAESGTYGGVL